MVERLLMANCFCTQQRFFNPCYNIGHSGNCPPLQPCPKDTGWDILIGGIINI